MERDLVVRSRWLISGTGDAPVEHGLLLIRDGRIAEVGRASQVDVPRDAEVIDLADCAVLPGLMDLHLHTGAPNAQDYRDTDLAHVVRSDAEILLDAAKNARLLVEAGFTTVRDLDWITPGGRNLCADLCSLRDAIAAGKLPGPRLVVGGMTHITGSHFDRIVPRNVQRDPAHLADGPWGMRRLARLNFRNGADLLKTCVSGGTGTFDPQEHVHDRNITREELEAVVDEAHAFRRKVAAHCHTPDSVRMALDVGVDTIEHCVLTDDDSIRRLADSGKYVVPTLAFRETSQIEARRARGIPEFVLRMMEEKREVSFETFRRYHRAGVRFAMGTDTHVDPPFGENGRELAIYVGLGLSEMEAIQTATRNAAEALGLESDLGTLETGKRADLIAVEGNPLKDITLLQGPSRIRLVVRDGRVVVDRRRATRQA